MSTGLRQNLRFERALVAVIVLALALFAYYVTLAEVEQVRDDFVARRVGMLRILARDVLTLLEKKQSLSARLTNLLAEERSLYALVQRPDGTVEAKGEGPLDGLGLGEIEQKARQATRLTFLPSCDPSGTRSLIEGVLPVLAPGGERLVLRMGFPRDDEDERVRHLVFRNLLVFTVSLLGFAFYWMFRQRDTASLRVAWIGGSALLVLLSFLVCRHLVQHWYNGVWRRQAVRQALATGRLLAPAAARFLRDRGNEDEIRVVRGYLGLDEDLGFLAVVADGRYAFHTDNRLVGTLAEDALYKRVADGLKPSVHVDPADSSVFEVFVPIFEGQRRAGMLRLGVRAQSWPASLHQLQWQLASLFLALLLTALFLIHHISRRFTRDLELIISSMEQVTAGDLRQSLYLDRHDEIGLLAQAYNFMLLGLRERDLLGKGLQQYVSRSIVNQTLKVISTREKVGEKAFVIGLFATFHGLGEAFGRDKPAAIFAAVREVMNLVRKVAVDAKASLVQQTLSGAVVVFAGPQKYDGLLIAIRTANLLLHRLRERRDLPCEVPLAIHCFETVTGSLDNDETAFWGDITLDLCALARVQDPEELFLSEEAAFLLRDATELEEVKVQCDQGGGHKVFAFRRFRAHGELMAIFPAAPAHVKILIAKILRLNPQPELVVPLIGWYPGADTAVRFAILEVLEKLPRPDILAFAERVVREEEEPKALSKAIQILGRIGGEEQVALLTEKLRTGDRRVKANAVEALERIGGSKVYEFFNLLLDEQDNRVKANILIALGKFGDLKVFDLLTRMLREGDKSLRASAAYALGQLGMAQGVEPLIAALSDKDPDVRRQVVAALSRLKADLEIEI